jgi:NAD(P)-dependent dehydrogenase (short-subunit alcohol dehydrogenase family)
VGIGEATIRKFAEKKAIVIADFSEQGAELEKELTLNGIEAFFIKTDVTNEEDVKNMIAKTVEKYGQVDIVFANAGIANDGPIHELSSDKWNRTIDINLTGVYLTDKYAIKQMLKQETKGTIVNCGSIHSHVGKGSVTAAKGGVKLLTQTIGIDYGKEGIRVNAICPGYIDTPLLSELDEQVKQHLVSLHPMGRLGKAEEVGASVLFLASEEASFITGTTLLVDGGYTAQ